MTDPWEAQREALGAFIREQRKRANHSLRQLAELTSLSNPYLSQVERGLHQPSVRVLKAPSGAPPPGTGQRAPAPPATGGATSPGSPPSAVALARTSTTPAPAATNPRPTS